MSDRDDALFDSEMAVDDIADTLTVSAGTFSRVLRRGLRDAVIEGKSLESILKKAALSISSSALNAGLKPLTNLVGQGANALLGGLGGGLTKGLFGGAVKAVPFAQGGVIGAPTAFGMSGGRVGLMGEAGREAVLPLARGSDGRLGVALEGQRQGASQVTINISTPDAESFKRSETQVSAMLARAVGRGRRGL